ncbi:growth-regulating factor 6-like [Iris pallida]|uniref:Growth-regulating factor n=1 Tax=Iris pallida TaxID=29817 RepID=A0AAX6H4Q0_IRIPA|nr:growth-regulating factor 6-like [Iris pallida]
MNRGRHRSRKHVEGHSGQASKAVPVIAPSQPAGAAVSGGGGGLSNNALTIMSQQNKSLQPNEPSPPRTDRIQMGKENTKYHVRDSNGLSLLNDASPKPLDSLFPMPKHQNPFEGTLSRPDFGLISTDSLLNPMRTTYSDDGVGFDSASKLHDRQPQHHHPLRHFIDDWPKSQSELPSVAWPKIDEMKSDRTQLSISIPSDISSSSSSPNQEKLALSPLRLSREFNPVSGGNQRQSGWIPISWEPTIGGPLGEVLNKTNSTPKDFSSSSLNLLPDGWDTSPRMQSSPTGVLQKTAFGSLSSSTGSSPRARTTRRQAIVLASSDNLLGATLANPSTVGSM